MTDCILREEPYKKLPGEIQIQDYIPLSCVSRILVALEDLKLEAIYELNKICEPYNIPVVSIVDEYKMIENVMTLKKTNC